MICLKVGLFAFMLIGTLCAFWTCLAFSSAGLGSFLSLCFQTGFLSLSPFLLLLVFLWLKCCVSCCLAAPLSYLHIFLVFCLCTCFICVFLSTLSSSSLIQSSASSNLLVIACSVFFTSEIIFFFSSGSWLYFVFLFIILFGSYSVPCSCLWVPWACL